MKKSNSQIFSRKYNHNITVEHKIKQLELQNISLQKKLKLFILKEQYYLSEIDKLKNNQLNNEISPLNIHKENKINKLKKKYLINKENTKKLSNDLNLLNQEIFNKNEIIVSLQEQIYSLNKKIDQVKLNNYFKEKEYENKIKSEKRKLNEIQLLVKNITKEASETLNDLSKQIENLSKLSSNNGRGNINNKLKFIENNLNELFYKMCNDFNEININFEQKNENINKLKYELNLLKLENSKLKKEILLKNNEIELLKKNEIIENNKDHKFIALNID